MSIENPLLYHDGLPKFASIEPQHVVPAMEKVIADTKQGLADIEQNVEATWDGLMEPLRELWVPFGDVWGAVAHLNMVKNSPELREAYDQVLPQVVSLSLEASQSKVVYEGMVAIRNSAQWDQLDRAQQRVIEHGIRDAELSGVALEGEQLDRFNAIAGELSALGSKFSNNVLDATKAWSMEITDPADTEGWPQNLLQGASASWNSANPEAATASTPEKGPWRITLDHPSFGPFLQHSRNSEQRKEVLLQQTTRATDGEFDNRELMKKIIKLNAEQAQLLGFNTFAEMSLHSKMVPDVATVRKMTDDLYKVAKPAAEKEFAELTEFAKASGFEGELKQWDMSFYVERLREKLFNFTDDQVRPYFPLEQVLEGLFGLCTKLFGLTFKKDEAGEVEIWDKDVSYYHVYNEAGELISGFYLDPYSRPENKRGGAWMNICQSRQYYNGKLRLPIVYLVCNGTAPVGDKPSLMSFYEVLTLFHEFGHGLHGMLCNVDYPNVGGTAGVEWDAVELPSQFMENWCYESETLLGMAKHYQTGEPLPKDIFDKILESRIFRAGSAMVGQLIYGSIDMALYDGYDPYGEESPMELQQRIFTEMAVIPPLPENGFICSFTHIFCGGYSAGYYGYKWAEVLSADAYAAFEEVGLENGDEISALGREFAEKVLARGGSEHAAEVFKSFRKRDPKADALLRHNGLLA